MKKKCTKCGEEKEVSEFGADHRNKSGRQSQCRTCRCSHETRRYHNDPNYANKKKISSCKRMEKIYNNPSLHKSHKEKTNSRAKQRYHSDAKFANKRKAQSSALKRLLRKINPEWRKASNKAVYNRKKWRLVHDINFKILENVRGRFYLALKNDYKSGKTLDYLGCTIEELKKHLESQFQKGMSWGNYGFGMDKWNIDHIAPCSSFDHSDEDQIKKCWHYTNMQPMWQGDNIKKSNKTKPPAQERS